MLKYRLISLAGVLIGTIVAAVGFGSASARADSSCLLVVHAASSKPTKHNFANYEATVELTPSVENEQGDWLKTLKARKQDRRETKTQFIDSFTYSLDKEDFCDRKIQVYLEGFCIVKAVTWSKQRFSSNAAFQPVWLPSFNQPSMQREFKAELY